MTTAELPTAAATHHERLTEASAATAAARAPIDAHAELAARVSELKFQAASGDLTDEGAVELLQLSERHRLGEVTATRRLRALDDALAAEVKVALSVLADLAANVDVLVADAATAADALSGVLVDAAAQAVRGDTSAGHERDTGRCMVEQFFPAVWPAALLADRIRTASNTSWGTGHVATEAALIVQSFDSNAKAIRDGIDGLRAVYKAAVKAFG